MLSAQLSRLGRADVLRVVCSQAALELPGYGGREVGEIAAAVAKLGLHAPDFQTACLAFCAEPPAGALKSLRDTTQLVQSLRRTEGAAAAWLSDGAMCEAMLGLARIGTQQLHAGGCITRDVAEFAHALTQGPLGLFLADGAAPHAGSTLEAALRVALAQARQLMHTGSARDTAMVAGAVAAAWPVLKGLREKVLRPALVDAVQLVRFRRAEFNAHDLALIAAALARAALPAQSGVGCFAEVLRELVQDRVRAKTLSVKDICLLLWAAARVDGWATEKFAADAACELARRDAKSLSNQDICTAVQSLPKIGPAGHEALRLVTDEAFGRGLESFQPRDQLVLIQALARTRLPDCALTRFLRSVRESGCGTKTRRTMLLMIIGAASGNGDWTAEDMQLLSDATVAAKLWEDSSCECLVHFAAALRGLDLPLPVEAVRAMARAIVHAGAEVVIEKSEDEHHLPEGQEDFGHEASDGHSTVIELKHALVAPPGLKPDPDADPGAALRAAIDQERPDVTLGHGHGAEERRAAACGGQGDPAEPRAEGSCCCCGHSHGDDEHGHGHVHVHGHEEPESRGDGHSGAQPAKKTDVRPAHIRFSESLVCDEPSGDDSLAKESEGDLEQRARRARSDSRCSSEVHCSACPSRDGDAADYKLRLNTHCTFRGHCVQMKNTFLHIPCSLSDSESEEGCIVCRLRRTRSLDLGRPAPPDQGVDGSDSEEAL